MAFSLHQIYVPLTALPFRRNEAYTEIQPCEALRPYVRCFWGTRGHAVHDPSPPSAQLPVVPDTCADIILRVNDTRNQMADHFCGVSNQSFLSHESGGECTFGIRFYAWSAVLFADEDMRGALNAFTESGAYFADLRRELCGRLAECSDIFERARTAEKYLLQRRARLAREESADIMNALYDIIQSDGRCDVGALAQSAVMSRRSLERLFAGQIGVSPKQMINMVRYQMVWRESLRGDFNVHDAVEQFGYYDQAHLLHDFKKYHGISLGEARKAAWDRKNVAFLQAATGTVCYDKRIK